MLWVSKKNPVIRIKFFSTNVPGKKIGELLTNTSWSPSPIALAIGISSLPAVSKHLYVKNFRYATCGVTKMMWWLSLGTATRHFQKCLSSIHSWRHAKWNECHNNKIPNILRNLLNCGHISLERDGYSFQPILKGVHECPPPKKYKSHFKDIFMVKPWRVHKQRFKKQNKNTRSNSKGITEEMVKKNFVISDTESSVLAAWGLFQSMSNHALK